MKSNRGIALLQTLLLTLIISVLLISMLALTRQHQNRTIELSESSRLNLEMHSKAAELQFNLLTYNWTQNTSLLENELTLEHWNFFGKPFSDGNFTVRIVNLRSLVSLRSNPGSIAKLLEGLVSNIETLNKNQIKEKAQTLINWQAANYSKELQQYDQQDATGELPVQHPVEAALIMELKPAAARQLLPYVQTYSASAFNPVYSPYELNQVLYDELTAQKIDAARRANQWSVSDFNRITGLALDELIGYGVGPEFRIIIAPNANETEGESYEKQRYYAPLVVDVEVQPYETVPIKVLLYTRAASSHLLWE